eukprot:980779-Rhodomonas_salina.3
MLGFRAEPGLHVALLCVLVILSCPRMSSNALLPHPATVRVAVNHEIRLAREGNLKESRIGETRDSSSPMEPQDSYHTRNDLGMSVVVPSPWRLRGGSGDQTTDSQAPAQDPEQETCACCNIHLPIRTYTSIPSDRDAPVCRQAVLQLLVR